MGSSVGNLTQAALGLSGFDNPGIAQGGGGRVVSLLSDGKSRGGFHGQTIAGGEAESYFVNDSLYPLLKSYELTESIMKVYESYVNDILSSGYWDITGTKHDMEATNFLKKIDLKSILLRESKEAMFTGSFSFYINYEKEYVRDLINPSGLILCKKFGKDFKYRFETETTDNFYNETESFVDCCKICSLMLRPKMIGAVSLSDAPDDFFDEEDYKQTCEEDEFVANMVAEITYYKGQSVISNLMSLLFEHFITSLLRMLLKIKNTTRPDLVQASVGDSRTSEINIAEAINNIEALLNQGDYVFDLRTNNSYSIISSIYNSLSNSVKVVPSIDNFSDFKIMEYPALNEKLDQLSDDLDKLRAQVVQNSGIPEELLSTGDGANKWEVLSRSGRFNNVIRSLIGDFSTCIKTVVQNFLRIKYQEEISIDEIILNIDKNNYLNNSNFSNRLSVSVDNLEKLKDLLDVAKGLSESEVVNYKALQNFIKSNVEDIDKSISGLIDIESAIKKRLKTEREEERDDSRDDEEDEERIETKEPKEYHRESVRSRSTLRNRGGVKRARDGEKIIKQDTPTYNKESEEKKTQTGLTSLQALKIAENIIKSKNGDENG